MEKACSCLTGLSLPCVLVETRTSETFFHRFIAGHQQNKPATGEKEEPTASLLFKHSMNRVGVCTTLAVIVHSKQVNAS